MSILLRILRVYSMAVWVGGLVFFIVLAAIAFSGILPSFYLAGMVVRAALIALHRIGLVAGLVYLLATVGLLLGRRDGHPLRIIEIVLAVLMLVGTAYSQFGIIPRMEQDRAAVGGDITRSAPGNSSYDDFQKLHGLSTRLEGGVLLLGFIALALGPIHGRNEYVPPVM